MLEKSPCFQCGKLPVGKKDKYMIEKLPHNGILWAVKHEKNQFCIWAVYYVAAQDLNKHKERDEVMMFCPECGKKGRIGAYQPDKKKNPGRVIYYIAHESDASLGTWGVQKKAKQPRCYVKDKNRKVVLKKLRRLP